MEYVSAAFLITLALLFASICLNVYLFRQCNDAIRYGNEQLMKADKNWTLYYEECRRHKETEKRLEWMINPSQR